MSFYIILRSRDGDVRIEKRHRNGVSAVRWTYQSSIGYTLGLMPSNGERFPVEQNDWRDKTRRALK